MRNLRIDCLVNTLLSYLCFLLTPRLRQITLPSRAVFSGELWMCSLSRRQHAVANDIPPIPLVLVSPVVPEIPM